MWRHEGLIIADRDLGEDSSVAVALDEVKFYMGDEVDLKSGNRVNLDKRIRRYWCVYHPYRYALASR